MTSDFSRALGAMLGQIMGEHGVTQAKVAERIGRTQGYVSEHLNGTRPPETDIIDAIGQLAGMSPRALVQEAISRMGGGPTPRRTSAVPSRPGHGRTRSGVRDAGRTT